MAEEDVVLGWLQEVESISYQANDGSIWDVDGYDEVH